MGLKIAMASISAGVAVIVTCAFMAPLEPVTWLMMLLGVGYVLLGVWLALETPDTKKNINKGAKLNINNANRNGESA